MAENTQATTTFANDTPTEYIRETLLDRAAETWVFPRYGLPTRIPANRGDTIQFVRYERLGLPLTPLSEGTTPDGVALSVSKVTATVDQWGQYATLSDTSILQTFHDVVQQTSELLGENWARVNDREIQRTLDRGTRVYYQGGAANRAALVAGSVPVTNDILTVVEGLRRRGARPFENNDYVVIVDTANEMDMLQDATFQSTKAQLDAAPLERGEFMRWGGCRFVRSNQIPTIYAEATAMDLTSVGVDADATNKLTDSTTYRFLVVGTDEDGHEIATQDASQTQATGTDETIEFLIPASGTVPSGVTKVNLYASTGAAGTERLQARGLTLGGSYVLSGTGATDFAGGTGIQFTTSGVLAPSLPPSTGVKVHKMYFIARGGYAVIENGPMVTTMTQSTTSSRSSDSDPLNQRMKIGYKGWRKDVILNENYLARFECASAFIGYAYGTGSMA